MTFQGIVSIFAWSDNYLHADGDGHFLPLTSTTTMPMAQAIWLSIGSGHQLLLVDMGLVIYCEFSKVHRKLAIRAQAIKFVALA